MHVLRHSHGWLFLCAALTVDGISESNQCRNPLFEIHWFTGRQGDIQTLSAVPEIRTNLRLCPAHNAIPSCCREAFETEQILHFNFWKQILAYKVERLSKNRIAVAAVQQLPAFNTASEKERARFRRVLKKFDDVTSPGAHAGCFSALVTYIAGMLCFACLPTWRSIVHEDFGKIVRILLTPGTCTEVWSRCESFSSQARLLRQVVLDSRLATLQRTSLENLEMFHDQQALCDWMHDAIAMHPFTTPSEVQREAAPITNVIRTLLAAPFNDTVANSLADADQHGIGRRLAVSGTQQYDAMAAGKSSGFDITWRGMTNDAISQSPTWILTSVVVVVFATVLGSGP